MGANLIMHSFNWTSSICFPCL